ncbi:hypothetical protein FB561_5828 [Kribbella amoyensis]|uniref:DUF5722 domain-containing protein n=1 Tax=Kribbella amoyensis TaxID=996641 RepID=A0A561C0K7_9ACTN|nr:DUF5722 domain-containing protein [Kribbella amoyensis]TWD84634.1 hypothetical protein FB561_5828 [Kribbella amoyensis]
MIRSIGSLRTLLAGAVLTALAAGSLVTTAAAAPSSGITGVRATDQAIQVQGTAEPGTEVSVYALGPEQDESAWSGSTPVATVRSDATGAFDATVSREGDNGRLYYDKYVAVADGALVGTEHQVDDLQITPANAYPHPASPTKKGLQVQMTADAEDLGVGHAAINVPFNTLMQVSDAGAGKSIPFVSQGRTFYFDATEVGGLDRQIKPLSDNRSVVNLILLLYRDDRPNSSWSVLKHPDADLRGGPVFAFNTKTAEGIAYYTAAVEFLAQRYTRADQRFGRATGFIVGNEVDAPWIWQNMGEKPIDEFLRYYERALRLTFLATRAAYSEARTYVSLTHSWAKPVGDNPNQYYPAKDVVDKLNALTKTHGDYPWNVAYHPYPDNLPDPRFWRDGNTTDDPDTTPKITLRNIELLPQYLARPEQTYEGEQRRVILSEQGCNTPAATPEAERDQAACYALAYYKVAFLPGIDSFILHRHVDHRQEGGLRLGLWWWDDTVDAPAAPKTRKLVYDVFRDIDTRKSLETTQFALDVIGIDDWSELVPNWDPSKLAVREPPTTVGASRTAMPRQARTLMDFADGVQGWRVSDGTDRVTATGGVLRTDFTWEPGYAAQLAQLWRGTDVVLPAPVDTGGAQGLSLKVRVPANAAAGTRFVKLKAYGTDGRVFEGATRLGDGGDWQQASIDLSGWTGKLSRIKVWVRGSTQATWSGHFDLDDIQLAGVLAGAERTGNVAISADAPEGIGAGKPVRVSVRNDDLRPVSDPLEVKACDGVTLDPAKFPSTGTAPGTTATFDATVARSAPADPYHPSLCFRLAGFDYRVAVTVPPKPVPVAKPVFDFDDGTVQGWQAGPGMASVSAVSGIANGPGIPQAGRYLLDGASTVSSSLQPKTMFVDPSQPLDLSAAKRVVVWVNSYGGAPNATGYEVTLTLRSGTSEQKITQAYKPDQWNEVSLDVTNWAGRSAIDHVEVTMHAVGGDFPSWGAHFQVDSLGWFDTV